MSTCNTGHLSVQVIVHALVSCKRHFYVLLLILMFYHTSLCFTNKFGLTQITQNNTTQEGALVNGTTDTLKNLRQSLV